MILIHQQCTPAMSSKGKSNSIENAELKSSVKRISPPLNKKKRKPDTPDSRVRQNQTGFSYREMQRAYRAPGRKKRKTRHLNPSFVQSVFEYNTKNGPPNVTSKREIPEEYDSEDLHHYCTETTPAGRGAATIRNLYHLDEGEWTCEDDSRLCAAILENIDTGPFGGIHWKNAAKFLDNHCHVQCKNRWSAVKMLYGSVIAVSVS